MAEDTSASPGPANSKDDEMAKKLMEDLKAQGVDVEALKNGENVDVTVGSKPEGAPTITAAPVPAAAAEFVKTEASPAIPEEKLNDTPASASASAPAPVPAPTPTPTSAPEPVKVDPPAPTKPEVKPEEKPAVAPETEKKEKKKGFFLFRKKEKSTGVKPEEAKKDEPQKPVLPDEKPIVDEQKMEIDGVDMTKENQLISDDQINNDIERQSYITLKINKTVLAIIVILILVAAVELVIKFVL